MAVPVTELQQRLADAQAKLAREQQNLDRCLAAYRATGDGIAESMRAIELAPPGEHRRRLIRLHARAEQDSYAEYEQRRQRWGEDVPGPLRAPPLGGNSALNRILIAKRILGSFDYSPATGRKRVRLLRLVDKDGATRLRRSFTVDGDVEMETLAHAIEHMAREHPRRLEELCQSPNLTAAILAAIPSADLRNRGAIRTDPGSGEH